ncbi:MAG: FAD-dependent oxidoreductase [Myxococcota bacterium]
MLRRIADVIVVGAGPAGAHAAAIMARGGLRVLLVDRRAFGHAGAQWLNDVPRWMFDAARVRCPEASKHRSGPGAPFLMFPPEGYTPVRVTHSPVAEVDMRALGQELAAEVDDAFTGETLWGVTIRDVDCDRRGRPIAVVGFREDEEGGREEVRLEASLFVDASGLSAVVRRGVPALASACPPPARSDLCAAAQEVRTVVDPEGAARFLKRHHAEPGAFVSRVGISGGFSVLRVMVEPDQSAVSLLTGAVTGHRSGRAIMDDFIEDNDWIGPRLLGGSRAIPLRRPYTHLVAPGLALLGDAACQVYAAHGSGIGVGLNAAMLLGDAVVRGVRMGRDPGNIHTLWPYAAEFHQRWGGLLCFADLFRQLSQRLTFEQTTTLVEGGLMTPGMVYDGLAQQRPALRPDELGAQLIAAVRHLDMVGMLLPTLVRMPLLELAAALYYPDVHSPRMLDLYEVLLQMLMGEEERL